MQIIINNKTIEIPSTPDEITLEQKKEFYELHGKELDRMLSAIVSLEDELDREIEFFGYKIEKMIRTFAFFANTTVSAIKESAYIDDIANIYANSSLPYLLNDSNVLEKHLRDEIFNDQKNNKDL